MADIPMEEGTEQIVTGGGSSGSVSISIHPLVVMNVSDHFTRVKVQNDTNIRVFGALLGRQKGRSVEICNSYELVVDTTKENKLVLDREYFLSKEEQFKQVFADMEFVGWYTTGDTPSTDDIDLHEQICHDRENSLLLKLNASARTDQLPLTIYESLIEMVEGKTKLVFSGLPYTLATEEAERIGVDHIARVSVTGSAETSAVAEQLSGMYGAVKMLYTRVRLIVDYLRSVRSGELAPNNAILRDISSLCNQLPVLDNQLFEKSFQDQTSEVLLVAYLASITKGLGTANEFISKVNVVHNRHGMARRSKGLPF
ncbi:PREDICTED: COP9 signalosome complex subunit 6-like [Amphimedon queenslandica]|uniref:COP9 signalosome complex subunit 6 n=1 Tax=Amphimedon queenslandica TaxID=400682 RepID=A0A1X7VKT9_AMPQE|nr:PREDICTED: COP9 signalosome complex subunit 6-like [Amphimedon queenslandica]|eukprot:XP_003383703.1 PREDICTED: COP9 signalosome complex subunit 6-like [Amphimedon queenslandica]